MSPESIKGIACCKQQQILLVKYNDRVHIMLLHRRFPSGPKFITMPECSNSIKHEKIKINVSVKKVFLNIIPFLVSH